MHVDPIVLYENYIRQKQSGGDIIKKDVSLTCMTMFYPVTDWFEIVEVPMFDLEEVAAGNVEYIVK